MRSALRTVVLLVCIFVAAPSATASGFRPGAVVADLRKVLRENYVLPEKRPLFDAMLDRNLRSGRYSVTAAQVLAGRLNEDLQSVTRDKHLAVRFDPARQRRLITERAEQDDAAEEGPSPAEIDDSVRDNFGIHRLEILPGNVRYLKYDAFDWVGDPSANALDRAIDFLSAGDAIIIDLRENGGGNPAAVRYLASAFTDPGRRLTAFYMGNHPPVASDALTEGPVGRLKGKPLYVLTSNETASAAEGFTGVIAGYRLGEIVGQNTAGAGFRNDLFPLADGFFASVSIGRAVLASTGKDWESVGIAPTIPVEPAKALDVALQRARTNKSNVKR